MFCFLTGYPDIQQSGWAIFSDERPRFAPLAYIAPFEPSFALLKMEEEQVR